MAMPNTVLVPQKWGSNPSMERAASPLTHLTSITTSATSARCLPLECLEVVLPENWREVKAMTFMPMALASSAISTTPAFRPEMDTTIMVSRGSVSSSCKY